MADYQALAPRARAWLWAGVLLVIAAGCYRSLLTATFIYEDIHWYPWDRPWTWDLASVRPPMFAAWGLAFLGWSTPIGHHVWNFVLHVTVALLVWRVGLCLWLREGPATAAAALFLLHPLAVPSVGYAIAQTEIMVALGGLAIAWTLLAGHWTWHRGALGGILLTLTLMVKASALGVLAVPILVASVRHEERRDLWHALRASDQTQRSIIAAVFYLLGIGVWLVRYGDTLGWLPQQYPWRQWPEEMLIQSVIVWQLAAQSILPIGIAFQRDWTWVPLTAQAVLALALIGTGAWAVAVRRHYPVAMFGILWSLTLIGVRLVVPVVPSGTPRAPEWIYAQQWYPALPGMIWCMVDAGRRILEPRAIVMPQTGQEQI